MFFFFLLESPNLPHDEVSRECVGASDSFPRFYQSRLSARQANLDLPPAAQRILPQRLPSAKKKRCVVASLCAQNAAMRRGSARSQVTHMVFGVDMDSDRQVAAAQIRAALPVNKAPFAGALALDRSASPPSERIAKEA